MILRGLAPQLFLVLEEHVGLVLQLIDHVVGATGCLFVLMGQLLCFKKLIELVVELGDVPVAVLGRFLRIS